PVIFFACAIHGSPFIPMPSNMPGLVLGFQIPALNTSTLSVLARRVAVSTTCSSVSALQGPLIINGRLFHFSCITSFMVVVCVCMVKLILKILVYGIGYIFIH